MGIPPMTDKHQEKDGPRKGAGRWPFDPMQPGDHEPVRLPEELERVQKQTGVGERKKD
jgi:hypothetical protein